MTPRGATMIVLAALAVGAVVGLGLGWKMNSPTPTKPETAAPAQIMIDGTSVMLERSQQNPLAAPKQVLPHSAKVERVVSVIVQPTNTESPQAKENPRPVTVDLSLIRTEDGTRRVVASSPDGEIVGGLDVPVEPAPVKRVQKWTVTGLVGYDVQRLHPVYGAMVSRTAGPFVVQGGFIGQTVFMGAGVRW